MRCTPRWPQHPHLFLSQVKEPKYYMCGDSPPPAYKGPGDAHSNQEWIWQRERYLDLFDDAPEGTLRGESTPFYLYNRDARRRIAADRPDAKLIAVLRDPVDRAYSNWMHLWMDGLEPRADIVEAVAHEQKRDRRGLGAVLALPAAWACTAARSRTSSTTSRASRCCCCATRTLVDEPDQALNRVFDFLGVEGAGDRDDPVGQLPAVRPRRRPGPHRRPGDPGRRDGRASSCRRRCGARSASR